MLKIGSNMQFLVHISIWKLKPLCNKGVWGVAVCYRALH